MSIEKVVKRVESLSDEMISLCQTALIAGNALMSLNMFTSFTDDFVLRCYPISDALKAEKSGVGFGGRQIMEKFEEMIREQEQTDAWLSEHPAEIVWVKDLIPFELEADHLFTRQLAAMHQQILGEAPEIYVSPAWKK